MTPGNNGASTPEDDDPFGYLYADGQANGAQPPSGGGYGYPNSVNRVRAVGTRQYGQQPQTAQTAPYGQVPQQGSHSQPNAHYAAPETLPGGAQTAHHATPAGGGGRGGRGPNTKGLLIGAIAVVAAVVIGIGVAMLGGDKDKDDASDKPGTTPTQSEDSKPSPSTSKAGAAKQDLPKTDAKALRLSPGMTTASEFKGAKADGGVYVTGFNQVGAKVTWTVDGIEKEGDYRLYARYSIPGVDANATLLVNGKANTQPMGLKNFINSPKGDWEKGWQTSWAPVTLTKGTNTIELVCNEGNQCDAVLDQLWVQ
ncbi:carbohydrate-binding protein [Streptomyces sp. A244]|uniref:CBM35 domain-containing protein n=1 Tax=Streptomyces sp. A244 TaxID=2137016 RepID=UPI000D19C2D2|nr:CBM35 domain-containing protein [Streptomyces sp. A244]PTH86525.1 carbohydrate-binding protein [Streptomyces sp. A244]